MDAKLKLTCDCCGKEYSRYKDREKKNNFCSRDCYHKSLVGRTVTWKRPIKVLSLVSCAYCSLPIKRWRYQLKESVRHFCNSSCKGKYDSLHKIADKACNWRGGKYSTLAKQLCNSRYRRIRAMVLKLDGMKCQLCSSNKKLEAHHIIEKGKNPALLFDITNLITLCKKCHCRIRGHESIYVGLFDAIVAKRPNSVKPTSKDMAIPSQASEKSDGVCREHGAASKEMICSDTPLKSGD